MVALYVWLAGLLACRALGWSGWLGTDQLSSWQSCARIGLALMFLFTGAAHFTTMRYDMAKMVPKAFAEPMAVVYFTGLCEILGAVGLLIPGTMRIAGLCLALLLIAMFPANIRASRDRITLGGRPPTPLPQRAAMQLLLIAVAIWSTLPVS